MKPTTKNKGLFGAYARGASARLRGHLRSDCPYKIAPNGCHRRNAGTWGAVYRNYWLRGFDDAKGVEHSRS